MDYRTYLAHGPSFRKTATVARLSKNTPTENVIMANGMKKELVDKPSFHTSETNTG